MSASSDSVRGSAHLDSPAGDAVVFVTTSGVRVLSTDSMLPVKRLSEFRQSLSWAAYQLAAARITKADDAGSGGIKSP